MPDPASTADAATYALMIFYMMGAGLVAGFAAGVFGIGGGFVVVPALFVIFALIGVDPNLIPHVAIGTSLATIIITSLRSVQSHAKRGVVDFSVLRSWAPWIAGGVCIGLFFADAVDGRTLTIIFAFGVFLLGLYMMFGKSGSMQIATEMPGGVLRASLAMFIGASSALLGIGGGTLAILIMTLFGKTIHQAVATAAGFGFIIAVPGAIGFAFIGLGEEGLPFGSIGYVNLIALAAITGMSILTAPLGAKVAHAMNAAVLKRVFATYLMFTTGLMFYESIENPADHDAVVIAAAHENPAGDPLCKEAVGDCANAGVLLHAAAKRRYQEFSGAPPEEGLTAY